MSKTIHRKGIEDVMSGYDMYAAPYYSLWDDKQLNFVWDDDCHGDARETLFQNLSVLKNTGTQTTFTIRFHKALDKNGEVKNTSPYSGAFNFRLNEPAERSVGFAAGGDLSMFQMILKQEREIAELRYQSKIDELENQLLAIEAGEGEGTEDEDEEMGFIGMVGRAGERFPWMQEHLKDLMTGLKFMFKKHFGNDMSQTTESGAKIAGIDRNQTQEKQYEDALKILLEKDTNFVEHLVLLAELAEKDMDMYELAIKKLKQALA